MKKILFAAICLVCASALFGCNIADTNGTTADTEIDIPAGNVISTDTYPEIIDALKKLTQEGAEYTYKNDTAKNTANKLMEAVGDGSTDTLGYAMHDINGDGADELVIMRSDCTIVALFALVDEKAVLVDTFDSESAIDYRGRIYDRIPVGDRLYHYTVMTLNSDGSLEGLVLGFEPDSEKAEYYAEWYGERKSIIYNDYEMISSNYFGRNSDPSKTTKLAGLMYVPLYGDGDSANKTKVDMSSYESIISLYKDMVGHFKDFTVEKWISGEYEKGLEFADAEQYGWYTKMQYRGFSVRPTEVYFRDIYPQNGNDAYGYDIRDINGDGTDELLLITDRYQLIAAFTMKDSRPVMLDLNPDIGFTISKEGSFYGSNYYYNGYALEQYIYELKDGETENIYYMFMETCYTEMTSHYYKLIDGKRVEIDRQEAVDEYIEIYKKPTGGPVEENGEFVNYPYINNADVLSFTPLFDYAKPDAGIVGKHDYMYMAEDFYIKSCTDERVEISVRYTVGEDTATTDFTATKDGYKYIFDNGSISGELVFTVEGVWFNIKTSSIPALSVDDVYIALNRR